MTLPASGPLTIAQILAEIGDSFPVTIPNSNWRTLAGKPTGPLVIPDDFWGKTWGGGDTGPVVTSRGSSEDGQNISVGTASSDRYVIVAVHWRAADANRTLTSINIGGGEGEIHEQRSHSGGASSVGVALCSRLVTSGTSIDIVTGFSGVIATELVGVWTMVGAENSTPTDSGSDQEQGSTGVATVDLTVSEGGAVFAAQSLSSNAGGQPTAWTGVDENYDTTGYSGAYRNFLSADASYTVNADPGITANAGSDLVAISWR